MSSAEANVSCPFEWTGHLRGTPLEVFSRVALDRDVVIGWHRPGQNSSSIVIMIGDEQLWLEFFDEDSLRRLRDTADHAIPRLREAIAESERLNEEFLRNRHAEESAEFESGERDHDTVSTE